MSGISRTTFTGVTYGVMGMGTEGGVTPYQITVAARNGWGSTPIQASGYSIGAMQFDFGRRGGQINPATGSTYAQSFVDSVNSWAPQNGRTGLSEGVASSLGTSGGNIRWVSETDRDTMRAYGSTSEGQSWINTHLEKGLITEYAAKVNPVLNQAAFSGWSESDLIVAASALTKAANQSPNNGFNKIVNAVEATAKSTPEYKLENFLSDVKAVEAANSNPWHFTRAADIAKDYVLLRESSEFGPLITAAEQKIAAANFSPAKIASDADLWFMRKVNSDSKFRGDLKNALAQLEVPGDDPSVTTQNRSQIVLVPESNYVEIMAPKGSQSVIVKDGEAYFYDGRDPEGRRLALLSIERAGGRAGGESTVADGADITEATDYTAAATKMNGTPITPSELAPAPLRGLVDIPDARQKALEPGVAEVLATYTSDGEYRPVEGGGYRLGGTANRDDPGGRYREGDYIDREFDADGKPVSTTVAHQDNSVSQTVYHTDTNRLALKSFTEWNEHGVIQVQTNFDRVGTAIGDRISGGVTWHLEGEGANRRYVDPNGRIATEREADGIAASDARFNIDATGVDAIGPTNPGSINAVNGLDLNSDQYQLPVPRGTGASSGTAPTLTPDLTSEQVSELTTELGLSPLQPAGPGIQYADNGYADTVLDTQGGPVTRPSAPTTAPWQTPAPIVAPTPATTTVRVNANTTFFLNEDGDIVSETVTGLGGYTNTRLNTGEHSYTDANGSPITQQQYDSYQADARAVDQAATTTASAVGFINAMVGLRNWDDMSDVQRLSALTGVISQASTLSGGTLVGDLGISGSALQGAGAALGFLAAAQRGDTAGMIINGTSFADAVSGQAVSAAIGNAIGVNAAAVIPGLNLIAAIANGDGMAIGSAAMTTVLTALQALPIAGQVMAAFMIVGSVLTGKDEPPQQHGNAQAQWGDQGELDYGLQYDEGGGGKTAEKYAAELMKGLQDAVGQHPELGVIPERVPRVGWVLEPGQDNRDRVYLEWFDDNGQRHTRWYTDEGRPQPNRHGEAAGVKDIASDFVEIALSQGAVAPAAQVAELRQNWIEAMAPVVALEAQIDELDKLAEPVRPFQRMEGQQGLIWYDSVNPLRLAELENQMAPLQQQAKELRAQARAQFDEELKGIEGVDAGAVAGNAPQTQAQLQLTKEVLADGSGTLYTTRDSKGAETRLLDANNTRDYDGKAEHTHGGERDPNVATQKTVEAGDKDLHSTTRKTIAGATVQTGTTVGVGDARIADGEDGQVLSGQDSTQQGAAGPGGSAVISQAVAQAASGIEDEPEFAEPAEDRATVAVGEDIKATAPVAVQPAQPIQETNTITQGQDAVQQAEGEAVVQSNGTATQDTQNPSAEAIEAGAEGITGDAAVTSTATPATDTITVKSGDSRITGVSTPHTPKPAPAVPLAYVPQQPATPEQGRRQAVAAMVHSAQTANPLGGEAGLAGLAAVGVAAAGAHLGAQAQPIVAQQVAQAAQAEREAQTTSADIPTGQAPVPATPAMNQGTPAVALADATGGPAQPLQLTQVNLGSYQAANISTQPAATTPAASTEPVQPGIRAEVTVQWQGSATTSSAASAPLAAAPAVPIVAAPVAPPAVLQTTLFTDQPLGGTPAPAPAPAAVAPPVPDTTAVLGGASGTTPVTPSLPAPVPATPLPITPAAQQPAGWLDAPELSLTVWGGAEDTGLLFTADMLAPARPGEGVTTLTAVGSVTGGEVALVDGQIVFRPDPHHHGEASFGYTVRNSWGLSSSGTARLRIEAVNDAPEAQSDSQATGEDRVLWLDAASLLANDTDVDGDALHIASVGNAQGGTAWLQADGSVRFQPGANYHGPAGFTYTVQDTSGAQATASVSLTVLPVNDLPQLTGEVVNSDEDVVLLIAPALLLANDADVEGSALSLTSVGAASHGSVALVNGPDGQPQIEFVPEADYHGVASFEYEVTDADGGISRATVVLNLAPANDAPQAQADAFTAAEDTPLVIALAQLTGNDADVDGDTLTVTAVGAATGGTAQLVAGAVRFTPAADYVGPASFVYTVQDGRGGQAQALATLQIAAVNDVPVVGGEAIAGVEDTALLISPEALLANDSDIDSANLAITAVGNAQGGTVVLLADGTIRFEPLADHTGAAGFDYTVTDGDGGHTNASVVVQLAAVNDAPRLLGETIAATEDTPVSIAAAALLANDADVDGAHDDLRIAAVGNAAHGSVALTGDGRIVFTPDADYAGAAGFDYTVADAQGAASMVRATLQVAPVNDAPRVAGETVNADEDTVVRLTAAQLLANDQDVDGDTLVIAAAGDAVNGAVALQADGSIVFTPVLNHHGAAAFTYTVSDGAGGQTQATVNLNLAPVNDAPSLQADHLATVENQPVTLAAATLLANDSDVDGAHVALAVAAVGNARHGSVSLADGQVTFTPDTDYFGPAAFDYTVTDADGGQATATAHVDVQWVNRAPVAAADTLATQNEDTNVLILAGALLANDSDGDTPRGATDSLRIRSVAAIAGQTHGSVSLTAEGDVLYVPDADYAGPVNFSYTVADAAGLQSSATAGFALANVNDAPTVAGEVISARNQTQVWIDPATLLANDTDRDSIHAAQDLCVVAVEGATHGSVALQGDGRILFTPDSPGRGSFTYTVADAQGATAQATAQVNTGNTAPVAVGETLRFNEDQVVTISTAGLLANDTDVDEPDTLTVSAINDVSGGSASLQGAQVVFTPWANYNGWGGFNYTVSDGAGGVSQANARLYFNPVNDAPVVNNELYAGHQDTTLYFSSASLLANETDAETPGNLSITNAWGTQGGSAYLSGSTVVFTPTAGYVGQASLQYEVSDPHGGVGYGTTTINLARVNRSPVAVDDGFNTQEDTPTRIAYSQLLSNDSDDAGAAGLRVSWVGNAQGGTVAAQADGSALFTPSANYFGQARFQYQVSDADNASTMATAYVNVSAVNDAPVIMTLTNAGTWGTIQAYDPDSDMSRLVYELASAPSHGTAAVQGQQRPDGVREATWTFASNAADPYYGPVSFAVRVRDAEGASATGTLWVNHTGGFGPVALDMDGDGVELVSAAHSLTFADVDADGTHERLGWVAPDDAVLAYDADDNGKIDIASETSFVRYLPGAQTDLEGLAAFDSDGDGKLSAADTGWQRFGALQDANATGTQDAGEFQSLGTLGIESISLTRQGMPTVVEGNTVFGTADVTHTDGRVTQAADVMFAVQEVEQEEVEVDETAHFNNLAQSFNQLCAAVAAGPVAGEAVTAAAPLAELSLAAPPDTAAVIAPLIEAANASTLTLTATG